MTGTILDIVREPDGSLTMTFQENNGRIWTFTGVTYEILMSKLEGEVEVPVTFVPLEVSGD